MSRTYKDAQRYIASNMSKRIREEERLQAEVERMLWEIASKPEVASKTDVQKLHKKQARLSALLQVDASEVFALSLMGN